MPIGCRRPETREFGFRTDDAGAFTRPFIQCCQENIVCRALWTLYRLLLPLWFVGYIVWYWAFFTGLGGKAITFLTCWSVHGFTLYVCIAAANLIWDRLCVCARDGSMYESDDPDAGIRHILQWFLFNIFVNAEIIVAVAYWTLLRGGTSDTEIWVHDISAHLLPAVLGLIDIFFSATPVHLMHFIYPVGYGVTYFLFAVIYWAAGGKGAGRDDTGMFNNYIYSYIDFDGEPAKAVGFVLIMITVMIIVHILMWGIFRLKRRLSRQGDNRREEGANSEFTMVTTSSSKKPYNV